MNNFRNLLLRLDIAFVAIFSLIALDLVISPQTASVVFADQNNSSISSSTSSSPVDSITNDSSRLSDPSVKNADNLETTGDAKAKNRGLKVVNAKDEDGQELNFYKESHALLIGVSDYKESTGTFTGWPDLPGVETDVQMVKLALEEQGFQVETILNPDQNELRAAFSDFIIRYGEEDGNRLLFYFAGHGHTLKLPDGRVLGYIVPKDAPNPNLDEKGFRAKALSMMQIEVFAKDIISKHALFLFDSCFSGSIFAMTRSVPQHINYKMGRPVRQFITAGTAEEEVPDQSVFRRQFIAALQGDGDTNNDGYVTGVELGEFLNNTVGNYSKGTQHPQYGKIRDPNLDKGDFVFSLPNSPSYMDPGEKVAKFTPTGPEGGRSLLADQKINRAIEKEFEKRKVLDLKDDADLSPEKKVQHWREFIKIFPDNNPRLKEARLKIEFWQNKATFNKMMQEVELAKQKGNQKDVERLLKEGIKFFEARKYELTMEKMKEALRLHPENEEAKKYLMMSKSRLEDVRNKWETGQTGKRTVTKLK